MRKIKHIFQKLIKSIFSFTPFLLSRIIVVTLKCPQIAHCLPDNKKLQVNYLNTYKINVDTRYPIEREMVSGYYDKETQRVIETFVKEGDVCFDIGANIGAVSLMLSKKISKLGLCYAFEPGLVQFKRLLNNIKINNLQKTIKPINIALSDSNNYLNWQEDSDNLGNASCTNVIGDQTIKVKAKKLDDFVKKHKINKVDFIKIDVEGMEYEVLKGSIETIRKYKPIIYYETRLEFEMGRKRKVLFELEKLLISLGYELFSFKKNKLEIVSYPNYKSNTIAIYKKVI
jgi:FkbM family methyltransferase